MTVAGLAAAMLAVVPASAGASTLTFNGTTGTYVYTASPGEPNNLDVTHVSPSTTEFSDDVAITLHSSAAPPRCSYPDPANPTVVVCVQAPNIIAQLLDGEDRYTGPDPGPSRLTVFGGSENDQLLGLGANETLHGEGGNDELRGREGDDTLVGGDGEDTLAGGEGRDSHIGGAGNDNFDGSENTHVPDGYSGGPGFDTISSSSWPSDLPITINLDDVTNDGAPGEFDNVNADIEDVGIPGQGSVLLGGPAGEKLTGAGTRVTIAGNGGDDNIDGTDSSDDLSGGDGNDRMRGSFGDDVIVGGPGIDSFEGDRPQSFSIICGFYVCTGPTIGTGNDRIDALDGNPESITCGPGTDIVNADGSDVVAPDCEQVSRVNPAAPPGVPPVALTPCQQAQQTLAAAKAAAKKAKGKKNKKKAKRAVRKAKRTAKKACTKKKACKKVTKRTKSGKKKKVCKKKKRKKRR